ncbi:hypothetical protein KR038_010488, partial [Drosophila bunnanda]
FMGLAIYLTVTQEATTAKDSTAGAPPATNTLKSEGSPTPKGAQNANEAITPQSDPNGNKAGENVDYCDPSLCFNGRHHVACNGSTELDDKCSLDAALVTITEKLRAFITHRFNNLRDTVARGGYNGLKPAARMATLTWDTELSHLAEYNVGKCFLKTDDCVNTKNYRHVGQIVGYRGLKGNLLGLEDILDHIVKAWVQTSSSSSMTEMIDDPITRPPKFNFLQMVVENAKHVGCAVLQQSGNEWFQTFFTCNFDVAPTRGAPIYESSNTTASSCQSGTNKIYKHLCSESESYSKAARSRHKYNYFSSQLEYRSEQMSKAPDSSLKKEATSMPKIRRRSGDEATTTTAGDASTGGAPGNKTGKNPAEGATTAADATEALYEDNSKLQKKFARFLKFMKKAELSHEQQKIVVITSNHEVEDTELAEAVEAENQPEEVDKVDNSGTRVTARSPRSHRARTSDSSIKWVVVS